MRYAVLLLCLVVLGSCRKEGPTPPPIPTPDSGTGGTGPIVDGGQTLCAAMCANLAALSCPDGKDQVMCGRLCITNTTDPRFSPTPADAQRFLDCRTNAKTQADAQKCGVASCR